MSLPPKMISYGLSFNAKSLVAPLGQELAPFRNGLGTSKDEEASLNCYGDDFRRGGNRVCHAAAPGAPVESCNRSARATQSPLTRLTYRAHRDQSNEKFRQY